MVVKRVLLVVAWLVGLVWASAGMMHVFDITLRDVQDAWWGFPIYFTVGMAGLVGAALALFWPEVRE